MYCQSCGKPLRHNVKYCEYCGVKVSPTCPSCGRDIVGNPSSCEFCGTKLNVHENSQERQRRVARIQPVQEECDTIQSKTKAILTSPVFITVVISYTIGIFLSVIGGRGLFAKLISSDVYDYVYEIAYWLDLEDGLSDIMRFLFITKSGITAGSILRNIPAIVICVGLWQAFISSISHKDSLHGTPAIQFIVTLKRIVYSVLLAGISLALIYLMIEAYDTWIESIVLEYGLIALVISWIVLSCIISYYKKTIIVLDLALENSTNRMSSNTISGYVIVANYFIGISMGILALFDSNGLSDFLMNLSFAVFYIALGKVIRQYDDLLNKIHAKESQCENSDSLIDRMISERKTDDGVSKEEIKSQV